MATTFLAHITLIHRRIRTYTSLYMFIYKDYRPLVLLQYNSVENRISSYGASKQFVSSYGHEPVSKYEIH
jgi:hypothetical protein